MSWIFLIVASLFEIIWATFLKLSDSFSKLNYSIYTVGGMIISFYFLAQAIKTLPIGTSYAIWTGIGAVGSNDCGNTYFQRIYDGDSRFLSYIIANRYCRIKDYISALTKEYNHSDCVKTKGRQLIATTG